MVYKTTDFSLLMNDFAHAWIDSGASLNLKELSIFARTLMFDISSASTVWALHSKCKGMWFEPNKVAITFSIWGSSSTLSVMMIIVSSHSSFAVVLCLSSLRRTNHLHECGFHMQNQLDVECLVLSVECLVQSYNCVSNVLVVYPSTGILSELPCLLLLFSSTQIVWHLYEEDHLYCF